MTSSRSNRKFLHFLLLALAWLVGFATLLHSTQVSAALIDDDFGHFVTILDRESDMNVGDYYYVISPDNKRTGLLRITKATGTRANADVVKGSAQPGRRLVKTTAPNLEAGEGQNEDEVIDEDASIEDELPTQSKIGRRKMNFRLAGGVTFIGSGGEGPFKASAAAGYSLGAYIDYNFPSLIVETGVLAYQAVQEIKNETLVLDIEQTTNLIAIPLIAKQRFGEEASSEWRFKGGFLPSYVLGAKADVKVGSNSASSKVRVEKRFHLVGTVGLEYHHHFEKRLFDRSLSLVFDISYGTTFEKRALSGILLNLGVAL